jgi:hypothetical protein
MARKYVPKDLNCKTVEMQWTSFHVITIIGPYIIQTSCVYPAALTMGVGEHGPQPLARPPVSTFVSSTYQAFYMPGNVLMHIPRCQTAVYNTE